MSNKLRKNNRSNKYYTKNNHNISIKCEKDVLTEKSQGDIAVRRIGDKLVCTIKGLVCDENGQIQTATVEFNKNDTAGLRHFLAGFMMLTDFEPVV